METHAVIQVNGWRSKMVLIGLTDFNCAECKLHRMTQKTIPCIIFLGHDISKAVNYKLQIRKTL